MSSWTGIIPIKQPGRRKTRLADRLSVEERDRLSEAMIAKAIAALRGCPDIGKIAILSVERPKGWHGVWIPDAGQGLNDEIVRLVHDLGNMNIMLLHADLPMVSADDICALVAAAGSGAGIAIAPDRHATGTNALALRDATGFVFAFGPGSFQRHQEAAGGEAAIVERPGLALDIDTSEDLDNAIAQGFSH